MTIPGISTGGGSLSSSEDFGSDTLSTSLSFSFGPNMGINRSGEKTLLYLGIAAGVVGGLWLISQVVK